MMSGATLKQSLSIRGRNTPGNIIKAFCMALFAFSLAKEMIQKKLTLNKTRAQLKCL